MREESVAGILDFSLYGFLAADSSFRRASIRNDNTHYFTRSKKGSGQYNENRQLGGGHQFGRAAEARPRHFGSDSV